MKLAVVSCLSGVISICPFVIPLFGPLIFLPFDAAGCALGVLAIRQPEGRGLAAAGIMLGSLSLAFKLMVFW